MTRYNTAIIGSGQGGTALAGTLGERGEKVLLVERDRLGGSCVNFGCTPSKALLASAHAVGAIRRARDLGIHAEVRVDGAAVLSRVRDIRNTWREGVAEVKETDGVTVLRGSGKLLGPGALEVNGERYEAERIVLNTGTSPAVPEIPGLASTPFLTNETLFDLEEPPGSLLVLGAGYIGLELGQAFARLGSKVTLLDRSDRPLDGEAEDVSEVLKEALEDDGITFRLGTQVEEVKHQEGRFELRLEGGDPVSGGALLVAAGRKPNTEELAAPDAGLSLDDRGFVEIGPHFNTSIEGVWAIGDCAGQPAFTHVSWEDYLRLLDIWNGSPRSRDDRVLAYAIFTDPPVGRVGWSRSQAEERGMEVMERCQKVKSTSRGAEWGHRRGFFRLLVEQESGELLGGTFVGHEAAELVQVLLPLAENGRNWRELAEPVFIHPTYGEALRTLARSFKDD